MGVSWRTMLMMMSLDRYNGTQHIMHRMQQQQQQSEPKTHTTRTNPAQSSLHSSSELFFVWSTVKFFQLNFQVGSSKKGGCHVHTALKEGVHRVNKTIQIKFPSTLFKKVWLLRLCKKV